MGYFANSIAVSYKSPHSVVPQQILIKIMAGVLRAKENPVVFLDLHANKQNLGRVTLELFADLCPKAAECFRQFCTGEWQW